MYFKHLPNALSFTRLLLIVPFLSFLHQHAYLTAFYVFLIAGFTDAIDGWLARQFRWQSFVGSFLDPMADKLLIASSFIALAQLHLIPWWLVALVFMRDLSLSLGSIFWYWTEQKKINFKPTYLSKINTVLQLTLVTLGLFTLAFSHISPQLISTLIILTSITTAGSHVDYTWRWIRGTINR